jgi:hypothetical protein
MPNVLKDGNIATSNSSNKNAHSSEKDLKSLAHLGKAVVNYLKTLPHDEGWSSKLENIFTTDNPDINIIFAPTRLNDGIKDLYLVDIKNQEDIRSIEQVSVVKSSFTIDIEKSITFYAYYRLTNTMSKETAEGIRDKVVNSILKYMIDDIHKSKN